MSTRINPLTGRAYSVVNAFGGKTVTAPNGAQVNAQTAGGAITVRTPLNPVEGSSFAVNDASLAAATNAITVQGSAGALIDGAASLSLSNDGAFASFVYDSSQWRRLMPRRVVGTAPTRELEFSADAPPEPPATPASAGSMSAADKAKLDDIQKQGATIAVAPVGFDYTVDWSLGGTFAMQLAVASPCNLKFSNAASGMIVIVAVDGNGAAAFNFPAGVLWAGGVAPTPTLAGVDVYTFVKLGASIVGSVIQDVK